MWKLPYCMRVLRVHDSPNVPLVNKLLAIEGLIFPRYQCYYFVLRDSGETDYDDILI